MPLKSILPTVHIDLGGVAGWLDVVASGGVSPVVCPHAEVTISVAIANSARYALRAGMFPLEENESTRNRVPVSTY